MVDEVIGKASKFSSIRGKNGKLLRCERQLTPDQKEQANEAAEARLRLMDFLYIKNGNSKESLPKVVTRIGKVKVGEKLMTVKALYDEYDIDLTKRMEDLVNPMKI